MKVLIAHNRYQMAGGEDTVVDAEVQLLLDHGADVRCYERHNDDIKTMSKPTAAVQAFWSRQTVADVSTLFQDWKPDVVHVHNTLSLISPSIYWAASRHHVPVVQTLHNFRLLCPQGMLLRQERACEQCVGRAPWPAIMHGCYRDSALESAVLSSMLMLHRALGTYASKVARFIALNEFCRTKFIEGGLPADKVVVKPNFVDLPAPLAQGGRSGGLFVGRLSKEKGIDTLIQAKSAVPSLPVQVIGSGPMDGQVSAAFGAAHLGFMPLPEIVKRMQTSAYLLLPSLCYENFPRTLVEAFACGLPVIASRHGSLAALVKDGETGLLFEPGNAQDLSSKMQWAQAHPIEMARMGERARAQYEREFSAAVNHARLMAIYRQAMAAEHCTA